MGKDSKIAWTNHTWSITRGCVEVSPACDFCYAKSMAKRNPKVLGKWGSEAEGGTRVVAAEKYWQLPKMWNGIAAAEKNIFDMLVERPRSHDELAKELIDPKIAEWLVPMSERGLIHLDHETDGLWHPVEWRNQRVFVDSLSDFFEDWQGPMMDVQGRQLYSAWHHAQPDFVASDSPCEGDPLTMSDVRRRAFDVFDECPYLDFLLLTKRPENIRKMTFGSKPKLATALSHKAGTSEANIWHRSNCWFGTTVENQAMADIRIKELYKCRDLTPVLFLSVEPLVSEVDLAYPETLYPKGPEYCCDGRECGCQGMPIDPPAYLYPRECRVDWVIVGGESGPHARPMNLAWARQLRYQCERWDVPFFMKQLSQADFKKTFNMFDFFPSDLQVREFPNVQKP
jgi:protein gp37